MGQTCWKWSRYQRHQFCALSDSPPIFIHSLSLFDEQPQPERLGGTCEY